MMPGFSLCGEGSRFIHLPPLAPFENIQGVHHPHSQGLGSI